MVPASLAHVKLDPTTPSLTTLCGAGDGTTSGVSASASLSQDSLTIGMTNSHGVGGICLVQGEGGGRNTPTTDLTIPKCPQEAP